MERAAALLAACECWQTACGVEEADLGETESIASALEHIHLGEFDQSSLDAEERAAARPVALIYLGGTSRRTRIASPNTWADNGVLALVISDLPAGTDRGENYVAFTNFLGTLLTEMAALSGTVGHLNVTDVQLMSGPSRPDPDTIAAGELDELQARFDLTWEDAG